jgi:membrane glycosyltransferase
MSGPPKPSANQGLPSEGRLQLTGRGKLLRQLLFSTLAAGTTLGGMWLMFDILRSNGVTWLEVALLVLFSITFTWIVIAFWSAAIGFTLQILRLDPLTLRRLASARSCAFAPSGRTAVVMPVYNEDTARIMAGFEANLRSLDRTGQLQHFDFYMLSDTQNPELAQAERAAWTLLLQRLGPLANHVFYRRREKNLHRKVGNISDFCQRWGGHYEYMVVLDADSLMTGDCILKLVATMDANPGTGLVQTVPIPVRQTTLFGRFLQFAAALHSPMLATGLAFWQTDTANYWGHNAIIRIEAFLACCGLPKLPGKGAFGGDILSHDFVEAALLRRAGWDVFLLAGLEGSYEELPSNLLDYATRDRRWVEGNIQHLALLNARGLHTINRLHFLFGAVAYISTLVWLLMLGLSTVDALVRAAYSNVFFGSEYQLFPNWQIAKTQLIFSMLYLTAGLLLAPKLMSVIVALIYRRAAFGGAIKLLAGALLETLFAILIAPLMMVFHSYFVVNVLQGRKVKWESQSREGRMVPWGQAFYHTAFVGCVALVWGGVTFSMSPMFFWWLMPVLVGLILAAPIVRYSSSITLGRLCRRAGIFLSPSETKPDDVLRDLNVISVWRGQLPEAAAELPGLPPEKWRDMAIQSFTSWRPTPTPPRALRAS